MNHSSFKNVLLADDDYEDREFFTEALKEVNPEAVVTTSSNGVELMNILNAWQESSPDIIFLDLNMPLKDGYQCLEEIKSKEELKDNIVVIFTTSSIKEDIEMTYSKGANLFVTKPNDYKGLVETIRKIFTLTWLRGDRQPDKAEFALNA
jgi:CheY-like chemotaxis protein